MTQDATDGRHRQSGQKRVFMKGRVHSCMHTQMVTDFLLIIHNIKSKTAMNQQCESSWVSVNYCKKRFLALAPAPRPCENAT